jgi:hypothetical protein
MHEMRDIKGRVANSRAAEPSLEVSGASSTRTRTPADESVSVSLDETLRQLAAASGSSTEHSDVREEPEHHHE